MRISGTCSPEAVVVPVPPTFSEAVALWAKLGFVSFGGPAAQVATMHLEVVERRRWVSEGQFLHALNFCMLLPGPEAQQLSIYLGWLLHGVKGGLASGILFVLPSAILLWALSWLYVSYGSLPWFAGALYGIKPVMVAVVACAVIRLGKKTIQSAWSGALAAFAFGAIYLFHVPFPLVILSAGIAGLLGGRLKGGEAVSGDGSDDGGPVAKEGSAPAKGLRRWVRTASTGLLLWWTPVLLAGLCTGAEGALFRMGLFFSKAAMVTFGGAYAVLPYVSQQAVQNFGWLSASQMLDGLAFAETTPGPLIIVLEFVGFLGAWNQAQGLSPLAAGTLGAALTVWCTFAPCFLWVFLGAPYVEGLRKSPRLGGVLNAVGAAAVGVMLNLAVWSGRAVLANSSGGVDWTSAALALAALWAIQRWKAGVPQLVLASAALGVLLRLLSPST